MREIKFRAWDKKNNIMIGDFLIDSENGMGAIFDINNELKYKDFNYTGLKDINGKEIYEGDIVRFDNDFNYEVYQHDCGEWKAGQYCLWENISDDGTENCWEVIGNAYQNPNLLK